MIHLAHVAYCRSKVVTHRWLLGESLRYKLSVHKLTVTDTNVGRGGGRGCSGQ